MSNNYPDTTVLDAIRKQSQITNKLIALFPTVLELTSKVGGDVQVFLESMGLDFSRQNEIINSALLHFQNKDVTSMKTLEGADIVNDLYVNLISAFNAHNHSDVAAIGRKIDKAVNGEG